MKLTVLMDYSEFLIKIKKITIEIQKSLLKNNFDEASTLAHELKITALLLQDSIDREELNARRNSYGATSERPSDAGNREVTRGI